MSIALYRHQGKAFMRRIGESGLLVYLSLGLSVLGAFALGRIYGLGEYTCAISFTEKNIAQENLEKMESTDNPAEGSKTPLIAPEGQGGGSEVTASRNGTKYYFPWCSGVARIKEENKITFPDENSAKSAGYSKAANCE